MQAFQQLMSVYADIINEAQEKGLEQGIRKGRKQGLAEGERALLVRLLTRRFGPLPAEAKARIRRASRATLERWTDRYVTASSLDDVLD